MKAEYLTILISELEEFLKVKGGSLKDFAFWLLERLEIKEPESFKEEDIQLKIVDLSRAFEIQAKSFPQDGSVKLPLDIIQAIRLLSLVEINKNPIKQTVVQSSMMETSTGFYALKELVKESLIHEKQDNNDKRAMALTLTKKGKKFLREKKENLRKIPLTNALNTTAEKKSFVKMLNIIHRHHLSNMESKR